MFSPAKAYLFTLFYFGNRIQFSQGVTELKAIFLDFAQLVRDQQAGIDEIEKNIDAVRLLRQS